jgi:hypothetical protein
MLNPACFESVFFITSGICRLSISFKRISGDPALGPSAMTMPTLKFAYMAYIQGPTHSLRRFIVTIRNDEWKRASHGMPKEAEALIQNNHHLFDLIQNHIRYAERVLTVLRHKS